MSSNVRCLKQYRSSKKKESTTLAKGLTWIGSVLLTFGCSLSVIFLVNNEGAFIMTDPGLLVGFCLSAAGFLLLGVRMVMLFYTPKQGNNTADIRPFKGAKNASVRDRIS